MPIRRINSTGRKKILREDAKVFVSPDSDGVLTFDAVFNLADYELPSDAKIFIEAYRPTDFLRFEYGTVGAPRSPKGLRPRLTEFATKDGLLFRVKITSTGDRDGLLLAEGESIPISDDEDQLEKRIPLLPPQPADLGQELWRIEFNGTKGPFLEVNNRLDWKSVAASPLFRSLVYPAAMRQILTQVMLIEEVCDTEDVGSWQSRWLVFACSLGVGEPPLFEDDELVKLKWIDDAVDVFSRTHQFLVNYQSWEEREAQL